MACLVSKHYLIYCVVDGTDDATGFHPPYILCPRDTLCAKECMYHTNTKSKTIIHQNDENISPNLVHLHGGCPEVWREV
jgi:hypothetical protein